MVFGIILAVILVIFGMVLDVMFNSFGVRFGMHAFNLWYLCSLWSLWPWPLRLWSLWPCSRWPLVPLVPHGPIWSLWSLWPLWSMVPLVPDDLLCLNFYVFFILFCPVLALLCLGFSFALIVLWLYFAKVFQK